MCLSAQAVIPSSLLTTPTQTTVENIKSVLEERVKFDIVQRVLTLYIHNKTSTLATGQTIPSPTATWWHSLNQFVQKTQNILWLPKVKTRCHACPRFHNNPSATSDITLTHYWRTRCVIAINIVFMKKHEKRQEVTSPIVSMITEGQYSMSPSYFHQISLELIHCVQYRHVCLHIIIGTCIHADMSIYV